MTEYGFSDEIIAEVMAKKLFDSAESSTDFAFQLFVERFVLPTDVNSYDVKSMKGYILKALKKQNRLLKLKKLKI